MLEERQKEIIQLCKSDSEDENKETEEEHLTMVEHSSVDKPLSEGALENNTIENEINIIDKNTNEIEKEMFSHENNEKSEEIENMIKEMPEIKESCKVGDESNKCIKLNEDDNKNSNTDCDSQLISLHYPNDTENSEAIESTKHTVENMANSDDNNCTNDNENSNEQNGNEMDLDFTDDEIPLENIDAIIENADEQKSKYIIKELR